MNLHFSTPPSEVAESLAQPFAAPGGSVFHGLETSDSSLLSAVIGQPGSALKPHEEFTIPADHLRDEHPLAAAVSVGWRSLSMASDGKFGAKLVTWDPATKATAFLEFNVGPYAKRMAEQVAWLAALPQEGKFELRYLVLPSIYVAAIWLHSETAGNRVYVLDPAPPSMSANELLPQEAFENQVRELARVARSFDSAPQ